MQLESMLTISRPNLFKVKYTSAPKATSMITTVGLIGRQANWFTEARLVVTYYKSLR